MLKFVFSWEARTICKTEEEGQMKIKTSALTDRQEDSRHRDIMTDIQTDLHVDVGVLVG